MMTSFIVHRSGMPVRLLNMQHLSDLVLIFDVQHVYIASVDSTNLSHKFSLRTSLVGS